MDSMRIFVDAFTVEARTQMQARAHGPMSIHGSGTPPVEITSSPPICKPDAASITCTVRVVPSMTRFAPGGSCAMVKLISADEGEGQVSLARRGAAETWRFVTQLGPPVESVMRIVESPIHWVVEASPQVFVFASRGWFRSVTGSAKRYGASAPNWNATVRKMHPLDPATVATVGPSISPAP